MNLTIDMTFLNLTYQSAPPWKWDSRTYFQLITKCFALTFNGALALLFYKYRSVRTPFNLYVLNLTCANLFNIMVLYPFQQFNQLSQTYFSSAFRCWVFRYLMYFSPGWVNTAHLLIAVNRFWAVMFPMSYQTYQRAYIATRPVFIGCMAQVYLHIVLVPGVIFDALVPRSLLESFHCGGAVSSQPAWVAGTQLVVHDLPVVLVLTIYPITCAKMLLLSRRAVRKIRAIVPGPEQKNSGKPNSIKPRAGGVPVRTPRTKDLVCCGHLAKTSGQGFLTLSFLSLMVAVSLLPVQVYFTLLVFGVGSTANFAVISVFYVIIQVCDPVMFVLTVKNLRQALFGACAG